MEMLRVAKVRRKQAEPACVGESGRQAHESEKCLTLCGVGCLHFCRGVYVRLFVDRYQQLVHKIRVCVAEASFESFADCYQQALRRRDLSISRTTKCAQGRRFVSGAGKRFCGIKGGRKKDQRPLAQLDAETWRGN